MSWYGDYKPYVPVAQRRAQAAREVARRLKKGEKIAPVVIEGRKIAATFWGEAWCQNLEGYSDFDSRLPRGRTYVRNGSVVHLAIEPGRIKALVSGSSLYEVEVEIAAIPRSAWQALKRQCAGQMGSLVELLQGKLSQAVMAKVTDRDGGLFPKPKEMKMSCTCPDYAGMCKHIAAVMYGVGNRLDSAPQLLFQLRSVDHKELIDQAIPTTPTARPGQAPQIAAADLSAIFDIEIDDTPAPPPPKPATPKPAAKPPKKPATTKAQARPAPQPPAPKVVSKPAPKPAQAQAQPKPPASKIIPEAKFRAIAALLGIKLAPPAPEPTPKPQRTAKLPAAKAKPTVGPTSAKVAQAETPQPTRRRRTSKSG